MVDIEKVKAGLKCVTGSIIGKCEECEYFVDIEQCSCNLFRDALAVIEEQERHIKELHDGIVRLRDAMKGGTEA